MKTTTYIMVAAAIIIAIMAYLRGGWEALKLGLSGGLEMAVASAPLVLMAVTVAGLIQVLISRDFVERWLGKKSGIKGLLLGGAAGALVPGGPYVYYPIAVSFFGAGAEIGVIITFITSKNLWSISLLPLELAILGPEITFIRFSITLIFPIVFGLVANKVYSKQTPIIREWVMEHQRARGD